MVIMVMVGVVTRRCNGVSGCSGGRKVYNGCDMEAWLGKRAREMRDRDRDKVKESEGTDRRKEE